LDLIVKVTDLSAIPVGIPAGSAGSLLVCDRCYNVDEVVVAMMQIEALDEQWALCGPCMQKLPVGYYQA
jgi:hypothetical protein